MQFPHEAAIVLLRTLELGACSSTLLVLHCAYLCARFSGALAGRLDTVLLCAGALRVLLFVPRPCLWARARRQYKEARFQPTPQHVARRLLQLHQRRGVEHVLLYVFYCWLGALSLLLWLEVAPPTAFSAAMWDHLQVNVAVVVAVRCASVAMFVYLPHADFQRGLPSDILEHYSSVAPHSGAPGEERECAICFSAFETGASVRTLRCKHAYHARCVDEWLLGKQNRCPLCQRLVGPEDSEQETGEGTHLKRE